MTVVRVVTRPSPQRPLTDRTSNGSSASATREGPPSGELDQQTAIQLDLPITTALDLFVPVVADQFGAHRPGVPRLGRRPCRLVPSLRARRPVRRAGHPHRPWRVRRDRRRGSGARDILRRAPPVRRRRPGRRAVRRRLDRRARLARCPGDRRGRAASANGLRTRRGHARGVVRPGAGRQRRRGGGHRGPAPRTGPRPHRAVPRARVGERGHAADRAHQGRPRARRRAPASTTSRPQPPASTCWP